MKSIIPAVAILSVLLATSACDKLEDVATTTTGCDVCEEPPASCDADTGDDSTGTSTTGDDGPLTTTVLTGDGPLTGE